MRKRNLRDLTDKNGNRYIEKPLNIVSHNLCSRECTFQRRGDCYLKDYLGENVNCIPGYIWTRVDSEGYLLDRDGWRGFMGAPESLQIRIDSERCVIDKDGNRKYSNGKPYKI